MNRRHLPLIVGSLVIIAMVAYVSLYRSSPGELAAPHAKVAGSPFITDCRKCHASEGLTAGCLRCHTEMKAQLERHRGYHDFLLKGKTPACGTCHSDHNGTAFELVNKVSWEGKDPKTFTHPHVDYQLKGAHLPLDCAKCHAAKGVPTFTLPDYPKMPRAKTYLGLSQTCISCHKDVHAHGLATGCTSCHQQNNWKKTPALFDHDKSFPLKGGHAGLDCKKCHLIPSHKPPHVTAKAFPFDKVQGKTCLECHKNPHWTKWVESCEACHNVSDKTWGLASGRMTRKQHAMTGFRLEVPHQKTKCQECHGPDLPRRSFAARYPNPHLPGYQRWEKNCESCHKDEHRGQFVKQHPHCVDCHSLKAFMPARYGVKDHRTYPLQGGHQTAACNTCHIRDRGTGMRRYIPTPTACAACHKDIHYGQFRKEKGEQLCEDCHRSTVAWNKLVFNHNTQSRFKLDQAHAKVACKECHPWVAARGVRLVQYKPLRMQCRDCHDFDH